MSRVAGRPSRRIVMEAGELTLGRKAMEVLRVSYTLPFVLASVTGVAFALTRVEEWFIGLLIPLDVLFLALFVNLSNDYFDHKSGVDEVRFKGDPEFFEEAKRVMPERFYWTGNAFDEGIVSEKGGRALMLSIAGIAILLALPIVLYGGPVVIIMGGIAFFLALFYTAPPLRLGARGLGELDVGVSFFLISFFSYFVIDPRFSPEMMIIAVTVGLVMGIVRTVDEMSGYDAHLKLGERDLCVILGRERAIVLVAVLLAILYVISAAMAWFHPAYLLLLLGMPQGIKTVKVLRKNEDRFRFLRGAVEIMKVALIHMILIIVAMIVQIF